MKKLNRRGYLTIEIVVASTIAFVIAVFLLDLTMKLLDVTNDTYIDIGLVTDKALITKNLNNNLKKDIRLYSGIDSVTCSNNICDIYFTRSGGPSEARRIAIQDNKVSYMDLDNNIIYEKNINSILSNITLNYSTGNDYYNFKISGESIFLDEDYDINIFVNNKIS